MSKANIRFKTEVMGQPEAVHEMLKSWNFPAPEGVVVQEEKAEELPPEYPTVSELKHKLNALHAVIDGFLNGESRERFFNYIQQYKAA